MSTPLYERTFRDEAERTLRLRQRSLLERSLEAAREAQALEDEREPDWEDRAALVASAEAIRSLGENERVQLARVMEALDRLESGTWGTCLSCGEPIDEERLRVVPETARCARCTNHH